MSFKHNLLNAFLLTALLLFAVNCDSSTDSESTNATVTGTLTLPAIAEGKSFTIIFDDDDDGLNGFARFGSGTCGNQTTIDYSISDIPEGNYYISAVVYVVSSPGTIPTTGDFGGFYGSDSIPPFPNASVPGEGTVNFDFSLTTVP